MTNLVLRLGPGGPRPPADRRTPDDGRSGRPRRSAIGAAVVALPVALVATTALVVLDVVPGVLFVPTYGVLGAVLALVLLLRP